MKVLFAVNVVLLAMLAIGVEADFVEDRMAINISERYQCYVPGQCQEYSINFKMNADADGCQKFCGLNEACNWWSYEPEQSLCVLFTNCTESGEPDKVVCPDCISGERLCPPRTCHGAFKCKGIFIDSFNIEHLEDCIGACNDNDDCMYFTLEKTHDHCVIYENCEEEIDCETCASGERACSVGYHGPTPAPSTTNAPTTTYAAPQCKPLGSVCSVNQDCCGQICDAGICYP